MMTHFYNSTSQEALDLDFLELEFQASWSHVMWMLELSWDTVRATS